MMAPKGPISSVGVISLIILAQTTENEPYAIPQMKRPTHISAMYLPMREMPTPIARIIFKYTMSLRRAIDKNLAQAREPTAAPAILTDCRISPYVVA